MNSTIISGASVSHADASLEQLEAATLPSEREAVEQLLAADVGEAFALQTCNRVEAYVAAETRAAGREALATLFADAPDEVVCEMGHEESLRHLFRVAGGLESLVVGEDQILGQIRDARETAHARGGLEGTLEEAVQKAIRVGERARTETAINEGVVSIASAAVKLVEEKHGLEDASAVVVGAGEMGTLAARHLAGQVDELVVANRTVERAESLAATLEGAVDARGLDSLERTVASRDVVVSATGSPEWVLDPEACGELGETFVVDITRPRDIPPAADEYPHLTVYDLDRLEAVTEKTRLRRREATERVESIVDEELERLLVRYKRKRADAVISAMYESAERTKATELERAFAAADLDAEARSVVEAMADSIVNRLLSSPTNSLRDAAEEDDWSTIHTALQLFDPHFEDADPDSLPFADVPEGARDRLLASGDDSVEDHR